MDAILFAIVLIAAMLIPASTLEKTLLNSQLQKLYRQNNKSSCVESTHQTPQGQLSGSYLQRK